MKIIKKILIGFGILLVLAVIGSMFNKQPTTTIKTAEETKTTETKKEEPKKELPTYEVIDVKVEKDDYFSYVTGKIKNNTNKKKSYIQISFPIYDKDGAKIGQALDNITDLEPNGVWKFKALITEKDFDKVDFDKAEVTGF